MEENTKFVSEDCGGETSSGSQGQMNQQPGSQEQPMQGQQPSYQVYQGDAMQGQQPYHVYGPVQYQPVNPVPGQPEMMAAPGQPVYGMAPQPGMYQPYQQAMPVQGGYQPVPPMQGYPQPEMMAQYPQYQPVPPTEEHGGKDGGPSSSHEEEPKHDEHKYGQMMGLVEDLVNGKNPDPSHVMSVLEGLDSRFWKGALVGVGATLLLTNDNVKNAIFGGFATMFGMNKADEAKDSSKD